MLSFYLVSFPIFFIAWALVFPLQAMAIIGNLKLGLVRFIIQHLINKDLHLLKDRLRKWGKLNGYEPRLIDEYLDKHTAEIVQRLESKYLRVNIDEWFQ
jgi:hypothetical protein